MTETTTENLTNFPFASSHSPPIQGLDNLSSPFHFSPVAFQHTIQTTYKDTYTIPRSYARMSVEELCHPDQFRLLPQQVWLGRYANDQARSIAPTTPYSGTIIYHGMGSGKTISGITIAEGLKYISPQQPEYRSHQRILFVVPAQLIPQVYNEIAGPAPAHIYINGKKQEYVSSQSNTRVHTLEQNIITLEQEKFAVENEYSVSSALQRRVDMNTQTYILIGVFVSYWEDKDNLFSSMGGKHIAPDTFVFPLSKRNVVDRAIEHHTITRDQRNKSIERIIKNIQQIKGHISSIQKSIYDKVDQTYHILSHQKFVNGLFTVFDENNKANQIGYMTRQLQKPNTVLIIDEYQNIISEPIPSTTGKQHGRMYAKLWTAIHKYAHPSLRLFLMSGTPIYDKPFEIGLGMNLLRPRIPFPLSRSKFDAMFLDAQKQFRRNRDLFKYMTAGYVSYFSGGNPKAYPRYRVQVIQCPLEKNTPQMKDYEHALDMDIEGIMEHPQNEEQQQEKEEEEEIGTILVRSRNCCNLALPSTSSSTSAEQPQMMDNAYIENLSEEGRRALQSSARQQHPRTRAQAMLATIQRQVQGFDRSSPIYLKLVLETIRQYSVKFAQLIAHLLGFYTTAQGGWKLERRSPLHPPQGTIFIFTQYREYGANVIAGLLDMVGFINYDSALNTKFSDTYNGKRYILWTGETTKERRDRNIALFNSKNNQNGTGIKILIGTLAIREGVSLKRIREVHIMEPWWNESRLQQIMYRAIRFCSHVDVDVPKVKVYQYITVYGFTALQTIEELHAKAQQRLDKGKGSSIPLNTRIRALERRWVMINPVIRAQSNIPATAMSMSPLMNFDIITAEGFVYQKAHQKQALIESFDKVLKSNAIDCKLHHWGNLKRPIKSCGQGCHRQSKKVVPEPIKCTRTQYIRVRPQRNPVARKRVVRQYINQSIQKLQPTIAECTTAIGAVLRYPTAYKKEAVRQLTQELHLTPYRVKRILTPSTSQANQQQWIHYLVDMYIKNRLPSVYLIQQLIRGSRDRLPYNAMTRNMIRRVVQQKDKTILMRFVQKYIPPHPAHPHPHQHGRAFY